MQKGNIVQNLNSRYLQAANAKRSTSLSPEVQVFVEGHEDIAFWRTTLQQYEHTANIRFRITQPSNTGKISVLDLQDQAGKFLILCVDSDFDFLLNGKTPTSHLVLTHPYIFHTYAYSIENYQCYAQSLHQVCVQATLNDDVRLDFVAVLEQYSAIVYDVLSWVIYFQSTGKPYHFSLSDCNSIIGFPSTPDVEQQCKEALSNLKSRVDKKVAELRTRFPNEANEVKTLQAEMQALGYIPASTYLFMQGHTLKNNVVLMMLKEVFLRLVRAKSASLQEGTTTEEGNQRVQEYRNQRKTKTVEGVLDMNTDFRQCFLYQKIQHDIEEYIKQFR
ncbi:MAG: DUF4435 domain-containing protein [Candidatus Kapabacteria bacterium]|jgi:hypothetical protein|nr:DUF4435 domain-containing protein [Candidatus Kapabacteria bacterium]